jgi:hypothetical protein
MNFLNLKDLFSKFFKKNPALPQFPADGILWRGWSEETEKLIAERNRPVLLFVPNPEPLVFPFLKTVFQAMPKNEKLRRLLNEYYYALYVEVPLLPEDFKDLGAGSRYNIAILSPMGFTPMATIDPVHGKPEEIVETIAKVLEKLQEIY